MNARSEFARRLTVLKATYPTTNVHALSNDIEREFDLLLGLLRRVLECDDLTGWSGEVASPLCDEIGDILQARTGRANDGPRA